MKKLWLLLLAGGAMTFTPACNNDDEDTGASCPVACTVPATAEIGEEMTIAGQGFAATAEIALRNASGTEAKLEDPEITASGFTGTVPATLTPGSYTVILYQDGSWEIGTVTLSTAADKECPVLNIILPEAIRLNEALAIEGIGFSEDMGIVLANTADQARTELEVSLSGSGVSCTIPEGLAAGTYDVILTQGNDEWVIAEAVPAAPYKRLKSLKKDNNTTLKDMTKDDLVEYLLNLTGQDEAMAQAYADMILGLPLSYSITYDSNGNPTSCSQENPSYDLTGEWYAIQVDDNQISGANKQIVEGADGMQSFTWTLENNRITKSDIIWQTSSGTSDSRYTWAYEGNLWKSTNNPDESPEITLVYDSGKFMSVIQSNWPDPGSIFTYGTEVQQNSIFGVDIAKIILMTQGSDFADDQMLAILLNLAGQATTALPSTVNLMGPAGEITATVDISYTFDKDGYVTSAEWSSKGGVDSCLGMFEVDTQTTTFTFVYE